MRRVAWRGQHRGTGLSEGDQRALSEWGSGTGKRDNGRNQILQKQIRKGLMGKGSREGESQFSNLDECVNGKGFNYAGGLGLWGHE